ncbi:ABC transporter permease [Cryobacterium sp. Y62]|uniref:ABC transporter permease n=2 Tax=unclassified Cryobacterium TaxID=2649013 RepID=UPI001E5DEA56|nr:ABC transporter permease [Cryobacterium sp. Y62]
MSMKHLNGPALGAAGILLFLVTWEAIPRLGLVNERYLPPASLVMAKFFGYLFQPGFWGSVAHTMTAWTLGLAISIIAASVLGLLIGSSLFLRRATRSTIEFLRPIPSVALIPLAVLLFGLKIESSLLLIVYASFWQVLLQVLSGVADVDPVADNTARSYGLGRMARIRYVVWPTTLPYLITGIRLASAVALILAITAELVIGTPGLGQQIALTQSGGAVAEMYALIVATGLIGVLINTVVRLVEKRVLTWHTSVRGEATT